MSKLIVIPCKDEDLKLDCDGFILGIKGLSVNIEKTYTIDEALEIINNTSKDIFVSLNKNMHNKDLELLKDALRKLNDTNIKGILYYDIAVVNMAHKMELNIDLVWSQEHMTTNYFTCNYWYSKGVKYAYLSSEITIDEILEIKENTNMKLMVTIFGHLPMFVSKRPLVNNYLETFNIKDDSKIHYLNQKNKIYPLTYNGCVCLYSDYVLNGIEELDKLKDIDYLVLNSFLIDDMDKVLDAFKNNKTLDKYKDKGFLYKETIYKVKK